MVVEEAGVPAVVNTCEGFVAEAGSVAALGGMPWMRVVNYPGHIDLYGLEERYKYISELVAPGNETALTTQIDAAAAAAADEPPETTPIVIKGTWDDVWKYYFERMWTDGLPIVPPTTEKVQEFLKYTDYPPDAILTRPLPPSYREATPWWVAVNGVMAGCRPEYMPVLIAMTKAWGEESFRSQDNSSTPGWASFTVISGPIKDQLGINYRHTYGKCGYQSNTSMGRFANFFTRNLSEIRIEPPTDMGTHGMNFFNLAGENDGVCRQYGWKTMAEEQGFEYGDNVVTTMSCFGVMQTTNIIGNTAEELMERITGGLIEAQGMTGLRLTGGGWYLIAITELVGQVIAEGGWDKDRMQQYIFDNAKHSAVWMETRQGQEPVGLGYYCSDEARGQKWWRPEFCESEDPNRLIPMFRDKSKIRFFLGGDEARNKISCYENNGPQGALTSMKIELPKNWDALYAASQLKKDLDAIEGKRQYRML